MKVREEEQNEENEVCWQKASPHHFFSLLSVDDRLKIYQIPWVVLTWPHGKTYFSYDKVLVSAAKNLQISKWP